MKTVSIMQPYLFPYIGYFQMINACDIFIFLDDVNYIKKGWINRNNILINESASLFTIPLHNMSQNKLILETEISNSSNWKEELIKKISIAYSKAPYFNDVSKLLFSLIKEEWISISQFSKSCIIEICNYLNLNTTIIPSSVKYNNRNLKGQSRIIDFCLKENATRYINAIGGKTIYNKDEFKKNGIDLFFLNTRNFEYKQFSKRFVPNLSIIDVLMFNENQEVRRMLNQYDLI